MKQEKKILVIGKTFPEPSTTAAGIRMMDLLALFLKEGYKITFASTASISEHSADLQNLGISLAHIRLNDTSFDVFVQELAPNIVLYDRFTSEEQFSWRVRQIFPDTLHILDTEDLHFLRKSREQAFKKGEVFSEDALYNADTQRELASMLRCDVSLIISQYELDILLRLFHFPEDLLFYLPFLVDENSLHASPDFPFSSRNHFITVGNLFHAPNVDALHFLNQEIWPLIRKKIPNAQLEIYGAYASNHLQSLHNEKEGFLMKAWVADLDSKMQAAKVCLVPLRFGAGLKGKVLQAMLHGTPLVSTQIGAEAMCEPFDFPGFIANDAQDFAEKAVALYQNEAIWEKARLTQKEILTTSYSKQYFTLKFWERMQELIHGFSEQRKNYFLQQIVQSEHLQSLKYMSKWIEAKNQAKL